MRQVAQASSGPEAIRQYRDHRPDVTLMDLRLPGLTGIAGSFSFAEHAERTRDCANDGRASMARKLGRAHSEAPPAPYALNYPPFYFAPDMYVSGRWRL